MLVIEINVCHLSGEIYLEFISNGREMGVDGVDVRLGAQHGENETIRSFYSGDDQPMRTSIQFLREPQMIRSA